MSDAEKLIADVARRHRIERCSVLSRTESHQWGRCTGCDFESYTFPIKGISWDLLSQEILADHLGEEIVKALGGLTRQWSVYDDYERRSNWVFSNPEDADNVAASIVSNFWRRFSNVSGAAIAEPKPRIESRWVSEWKPVQS